MPRCSASSATKGTTPSRTFSAARAPTNGGPEARRRSRNKSAVRAFFEVGIAVETVLVKLQQPSGLFVVEQAVPHGSFDVGAQLGNQCLGRERDVLENLAYRVALDDGIEHYFTLVVQAHMYGVGVTKQVVQISEDLLVGAN